MVDRFGFQSIDFPRPKGFRFPRSVISYAVWAYHRFALSTSDVEDLLAERGIGFSRETIRNWVNRFGRHFARCIRRDRPKPNTKWHLDEAVFVIGGVNYWLWRAIDGDGDVLDILVQSRRNAKTARRFFGALVTQFGEPRVVVTNELRSYTKPVLALAPDADHRAHKGLNNRIENSHHPTRKREKIMGRFKSWSGLALNKTVILLDDIVEVFHPRHLDRDWAAEALQHPIDFVDAGGVGTALINHDLARHTVCFKGASEEFCGCRLFRRLDSMKSSVFPNLSTAR